MIEIKQTTKQMLQTAYETYGTPTYIFDLDVAKDVYRRFDVALNSSQMTSDEAQDTSIQLCYAMKTNSYIVDEMATIADRIEVCSIGEVQICKKLQIPPEKLFLSGVLKRPEDINQMLDYCREKAHITIESLEHFAHIKNWCEKTGVQVKVYPRLSSGNQFGMDQATILDLIKNRESYPLLTFAGLHYFSGTQKKSTKKNLKELTMLDEYLQQIENETGLRLSELEYGTGEKAAYFEDDVDNRFEDMRTLGAAIRNMTFRCKVTLEMGRAFAYDCGYYMTKIWDVKNTDDTSSGVKHTNDLGGAKHTSDVNSDTKNYCIVDGGIHQINYDGQIRGMYLPQVEVLRGSDCETTKNIESCDGATADAMHDDATVTVDTTEKTDAISANDSDSINTTTYTICGALCTGNDVLIQSFESDTLHPGDVLVFCNAGAYSMTEGASLFLSHDLPKIVTYSAEKEFNLKRDSIATWQLNM